MFKEGARTLPLALILPPPRSSVFSVHMYSHQSKQSLIQGTALPCTSGGCVRSAMKSPH